MYQASMSPQAVSAQPPACGRAATSAPFVSTIFFVLFRFLSSQFNIVPVISITLMRNFVQKRGSGYRKEVFDFKLFWVPGLQRSQEGCH